MVKRVGAARVYTTSEVAEAERQELVKQYLDGEIDEQTYFEKADDSIPDDELEEGMKRIKSNKYEELQEKFLNDEITDEEMDAEMDRLFEGGEEFLKYGEDEDDESKSGDLASLPLFIPAIFLSVVISIVVILITEGSAAFAFAVFGVLLSVYALL